MEDIVPVWRQSPAYLFFRLADAAICIGIVALGAAEPSLPLVTVDRIRASMVVAGVSAIYDLLEIIVPCFGHPSASIGRWAVLVEACLTAGFIVLGGLLLGFDVVQWQADTQTQAGSEWTTYVPIRDRRIVMVVLLFLTAFLHLAFCFRTHSILEKPEVIEPAPQLVPRLSIPQPPRQSPKQSPVVSPFPVSPLSPENEVSIIPPLHTDGVMYLVSADQLATLPRNTVAMPIILRQEDHGRR